MPRIESLGQAVLETFDGSRDHNIPFDKYIYDINFDQDFKIKIETQLKTIIMNEKSLCKHHCSTHNRLNKQLNRRINIYDIKIAIDN